MNICNKVIEIMLIEFSFWFINSYVWKIIFVVVGSICVFVFIICIYILEFYLFVFCWCILIFFLLIFVLVGLIVLKYLGYFFYCYIIKLNLRWVLEFEKVGCWLF